MITAYSVGYFHQNTHRNLNTDVSYYCTGVKMYTVGDQFRTTLAL